MERAKPPVPFNLDNLKQALEEEFMKEEDPDKVWQDVQETIQKEEEPVGEYIQRFSSLWEDLCRALHPQVPPKMMKKDCFMIGLKTVLGLRVGLKKPRSYEDAINVAKRKEWKLSKMSQLRVVDSFPMEKEIRRLESTMHRAPLEVYNQ